MQPYLFPYIGYFQLIGAVDKFVLYDDVSYINRGWINRNNILMNGKAALFTVPLKDASQNRNIRDIELAAETRWREKLMKSLEMNYKKAPYFDQAYPLLSGILHEPVYLIRDLVAASLRAILAYLEIVTDVVDSSVQYNNDHLRAQDRILDICLQEGAGVYINPIGGTALYNREHFADAGVTLQFLRPKPVRYPQFSGEFVSWLSIIDVLMFNSPSETRDLLKQYELL
jgi:hypothetical protein